MTSQSSCSPLPYNYVFLRRLGSLNRWRLWSFDPTYNPLSSFSKKCVDWSSAIIRHTTLINFYWLTMTLILEFLDGISLIQISVSGYLLLTTDIINIIWKFTVTLVGACPYTLTPIYFPLKRGPLPHQQYETEVIFQLVLNNLCQR